MSENGNADALPPLVEPVHCPDVFANGIARVERIGGDCVRIVMYTNSFDEAGRPIRLVVAKLVRPISMLINRTNLLALLIVPPLSTTLELH